MKKCTRKYETLRNKRYVIYNKVIIININIIIIIIIIIIIT